MVLQVLSNINLVTCTAQKCTCAYSNCFVGLQVLSNINSGTFAVTGKSIGLMLSPAAEKVRSPPPPSLAGGAKSGASPNLARGGRPGSAEQRPRSLESPGGRGGFGTASKR